MQPPSRPDLSELPDAPGSRHEFLLAESQRLTAEIAELSKESSRCVTFALTASVAIWSWLLANSDSPYLVWIAVMPAIATIMWGVRSLVLARAMGEIGCYLAETELLYFSGRHGWETHLSPAGPRTGMREAGVWKIGYYAMILVLNVSMAVLVIRGAKEVNTTSQKQSQQLKQAVEKLTDALTAVMKSTASP